MSQEYQSDPKLERLVAWAERHGAEISSKVKFVNKSEEGSTLVSTEPISSDTTLITLPNELMINLTNPRVSSFPYFTQTFLDSLPDSMAALKLFLAVQRLLGSESFWAEYMDVLPKEDQLTTPLYFSQEELQFLTGTNLGESLAAREKAWKTEFTQLRENSHLSSEFWEKYPVDWQMYLWACTIFTSRSFPSYISFHEAEGLEKAMLIPIIDSINHKPLTKVHWNAEEPGKFRYVYGSDVPTPGTEIFNNYGAKGNEELLMGYGFCLPENMADHVALKIHLPEKILQYGSAKGIDITEDQVFYITRTEPQLDKLKWAFQVTAKRVPEEDFRRPRCELEGMYRLLVSLRAKRHKLVAPSLPDPANYKQRCVAIYREGQVEILDAAIAAVSRDLKELQESREHQLFTLKKAFQLAPQFADAVAQTFGTADVAELRDSGFEEQVFVLFLIMAMNNCNIALESYEWIFDETLPQHITSLFGIEIEEPIKEMHESLIPAFAAEFPQLFDTSKGDWSVEILQVLANIIDLETSLLFEGDETVLALVN